MKFAWSMGGGNHEKIMDIVVMPQSEEIFFAVGAAGTNGVSSTSNFK